jgi:hypothetical protein
VHDRRGGDAVAVLELDGGVLEGVLAPSDEDDVVSVTGELAGERATDTAGSSGDEGSLLHGRTGGRGAGNGSAIRRVARSLAASKVVH